MQLAPEYQWWRFNIIVPERDVLIEKIFANGLFASTHYPSLAGIVVPGSCSHAENLHQGVINLFNDFRISVENVIKLIAIVKEHNC